MKPPRVRPLREIGRSIGNTVLEGIGRAVSRVQETRPLDADLLESDDAYLVLLDAPGATASDIQVRYRKGNVLVRIDRFREYHEGFEMRFPGRGLSLDARVPLPQDAIVDADHATASLQNDGTLSIELPKRQTESDGETVPIDAGDDS